MATTLSDAPTTLFVDSALANTYPPITLAQPEKTQLKDDHARTLLLSVLPAQVTTTPASPNAPHALPPLMCKWYFSDFPPLVFLTGGLILYFLGVLFFP